MTDQERAQYRRERKDYQMHYDPEGYKKKKQDSVEQQKQRKELMSPEQKEAYLAEKNEKRRATYKMKRQKQMAQMEEGVGRPNAKNDEAVSCSYGKDRANKKRT